MNDDGEDGERGRTGGIGKPSAAILVLCWTGVGSGGMEDEDVSCMRHSSEQYGLRASHWTEISEQGSVDSLVERYSPFSLSRSDTRRHPCPCRVLFCRLVLVCRAGVINIEFGCILVRRGSLERRIEGGRIARCDATTRRSTRYGDILESEQDRGQKRILITHPETSFDGDALVSLALISGGGVSPVRQRRVVRWRMANGVDVGVGCANWM